MKLQIKYARTIQIRNYEPVTIEAVLSEIEPSGDIPSTIQKYTGILKNEVNAQLLTAYMEETGGTKEEDNDESNYLDF